MSSSAQEDLPPDPSIPPIPPSDQPTVKQRRIVKPLPPILLTLSLANLQDFQVQSEKLEVKDNENPQQTKLVEHVVSIEKDGEFCNLWTLTLDQLRKLCISLQVKKSNLTKLQACYWVAQVTGDIGALWEAVSTWSRRISTTCRVINAIFHRDNVTEFTTFNNSRAHSTHETGGGGTFQRFWSKIVQWVNGSSSATNDNLTDEDAAVGLVSISQQIQQSQHENRGIVLDEEGEQKETGDDDNNNGLNEAAPYDICFLSYKENTDEGDPYNDHISHATTEEKIDPSLLGGMVEQVSEQDVHCLIMDLNKVQHKMKKCMEQSGLHDSNPMNFAVAGIKQAKVNKIDKFTAYYFFMKTLDFPDYDFHFSLSLAASMQIDSSNKLIDLSSEVTESKSCLRCASPNTTMDAHQQQLVQAIEKAGAVNLDTEACKQQLFAQMKENKLLVRLHNFKDMYK